MMRLELATLVLYTYALRLAETGRSYDQPRVHRIA